MTEETKQPQGRSPSQERYLEKKKGLPYKDFPFVKNFKDAMYRKGWSQTETATRLGLHRGSVSDYVTGKAKPEPANMAAIAKLFGAEVDDLWPGYGDISAATSGPYFTMQSVAGGMQIRLNVTVEPPVAFKIHAILQEADALPDTE